MAQRKVSIEIASQQITLLTDASDEQVQQVVQLVESACEKVLKNSGQPLTAKTALLAMLNMAEQHVELKRHFEDFKSQVIEDTDRVLQALENVVQSNQQSDDVDQ